MSRNNKNTENKGIINELHSEMCETVYRYLFYLMITLRRQEIDLNLDETIIVRFWIDFTDSSKTVYVYVQESKSTGRKHIGNISTKSNSAEDVVLNYILDRKDFIEVRSEKYAKWFSNLKNKMQELLDEQKKFEEILNDLRSIPMFSPEREVLIEKK